MSVIPVTLFFSLLLAGLFIGLFVWEHRRRSFGGLERDSLLPLADEGTQAAPPVDAPHSHDHDGHGDKDCGCRTGKRAPCPACLKQVRPSPRSSS